MSKFNNFRNYNPDILETIANLSNDEVFTPPKLANQILGLLPEEVWNNPEITFLDPAVKTGIFLREIASRLIDGLADQIPDLQERVNHILTKQVFGIGITELTTLMARRTVYCSMYANGEFSICTEFDDEKGNIIFPDTEHTWDKNGRCEFCGANRDSYGGGANRESYAYPFIHDNFEKEFGNMKFDVIIGNPPYHLSTEGVGSKQGSARAIYHLFVDKAIELNPKYITMIIPSRWMSKTAGGVPLDWVDKMIDNNKIKEMHDFINSEDCFEGVVIRGGVNYFLWENSYLGKCEFHQHIKNNETKVNKQYLNSFNSGIVVRDINALSIVEKVIDVEGDYLKDDLTNFTSMVSPRGFFISSDNKFTSNWPDNLPEFSEIKDDVYTLKYYTSKFLTGYDMGWTKRSYVLKNKDSIDLHKVYVNYAGDNTKFGGVIAHPKYSEPNSVPSGTYLVIGYDPKKHNFSKEECLNIISYMKTKFFRFMVDIRKTTQHCTRKAYQFAPLQDWSKPWTDAELYVKYKLTEEEIAYIEDNIDPMGDQDDPEEVSTEDSVDPDNSEFGDEDGE